VSKRIVSTSPPSFEQPALPPSYVLAAAAALSSGPGQAGPASAAANFLAPQLAGASVGARNGRPLVKTYSFKIANDLARVVCLLLITVATWGAAGAALDRDWITPEVAGALKAAIPAFLVILMLLLFPLQRRASDRPVAPGLGDVAGLAALAWPVAMVVTAQAGMQDGAVLRAGAVATLWIAACAGLADALCNLVLRSTWVWPHLTRNVAIYGVCADSPRVYEEIGKTYGLRYAGLFEDRAADRLPVPVAAIDGGVADLVDLIARGKIDEVVITLPAAAKKRIAEITKSLQQYPVDVHLCTSAAAPGQGPVEPGPVATSIGAASMTRVQTRPIRDWGSILKGLEDGVIGTLMLVGLAPVFLAIAVAIKLDSAGPVFFRQRRHGVSGQAIVVWKFRTMRVMDNGPVVMQATKGDPRVTKVGRFLRATSLDELPQLLNVMLGEMSLVGPRPHAVAHDEYYGALIESYVGRHQVKPGITGWAQINGLRGETQTPEQMAKRVEFDIWYIKNWSLWLDLKIILLTPVFGLVHKNAY
jgi:Undecaprenyl-phosphate glucose phosphotransferase